MGISPDGAVYVCNNGGLRFEDFGDHIGPVALAYAGATDQADLAQVFTDAGLLDG